MNAETELIIQDTFNMGVIKHWSILSIQDCYWRQQCTWIYL